MCISNSVGKNGNNSPLDVKTVQLLLNLSAPSNPPLAEDGEAGPSTIAAIESFQRTVVGVTTPDGVVIPNGATLAKLRATLPAGFSSAKLKGTMINATDANVLKFAPAVLAKMIARDISTPLRQLHFLAQVGHESGELRYTEEIASGAAYEGRKDLGNTQPGDGERFKGRGLIQLTGRTNYQNYGNAIGVDLVTNNQWTRVATDPDLAVDVAAWYWDTHNLNQYADADDIETITRKINGGLNGLDDRKRIAARARFFLQQ